MEKRINMPNRQKPLNILYKNIQNKLHILNQVTLQWISMSSSIKYNLARLICKCTNFASSAYY